MTRTTTNAHQRTPGGSPREFLLAIACLVAGVVTIEVGYRTLGIEPSQRDTVRLWSTQRVAVDEADEPVVFLGSSRILHAVHLETLERTFPEHDFFQLGVVGSSPLVLIDRFAADASFDGTLIAEYYPTFLYGGSGASRGLVHPWLSWFDSRSWIDDFESQIRMALKEVFVLGNVETRPTFVAYNALVKGTPPRRTHLHIHANRWQEADFTRYDSTRWTDTGEHRLSAREIDARIATTRHNIELIRSRGGRVIFLRTVTSGHVRAIERELYPRKTHFERFVEGVGAESLHFEDVAEMRDLEAPDGRHLDGAGAISFTRALATVLERRGLLMPTPGHDKK